MYYNSIIPRIFIFFLIFGIFTLNDLSATTHKTKRPPANSYITLQPTDIDIIFANVGQGNGVFLQNKANNKIVMIDAGSSSRPDDGTADNEELAVRIQNFLISSLRNNTTSIGESYIIIISHPDKDHINLLNLLMRAGYIYTSNIQDFYLGGDISHYNKKDSKELLNHIVSYTSFVDKIKILSHDIAPAKTQDFLRSFLKQMEPRALINININQTIAQNRRSFIMHLPIDSFFAPMQDRRLEFLGINAYNKNPTHHICNDDDTRDECLTNANINLGGTVASNGEAVNGSSAVVRLQLGDANFIFTGDATGGTTDRVRETIVVNHPERLKARILLASHHGADTHNTNSSEWAATTQPETVVFSAGFYGGFNHPRFKAVYNYLEYLLEDTINHSIIIHNTEDTKENIKKLTNLGMFHVAATDIPEGWIKMQTTKRIYTTSCPPTGQNAISFTINSVGEVISYPNYG